jgi:hypothetical protein
MSERLDNRTIQDEISKFDADTIRSGAAFSLLETAEDELTRERILACLKARAISVGIKAGDFTAMAKAAKNDLKRKAIEAKKAEQQAKRDSDRAKVDEQGTLDGLAEMMEDGVAPDFGSYICTNRSVLASGPQGQIYEIIGHPLFPTVRYVNIETGSELLDLSYKMDGRWKKVHLVDRKTISQSKTITALSEYGLNITSENARDVVVYLAEMDKRNRDHIVKRETVSHLGWVDGRGFSPYIDGVEYDSGGKFADAYAAVHEKGSFDVWKETAEKIMSDPVCLPARICLAASVASVILKWTSNQPFIVHLWSSESGTGKTIAAMLAASVWADPTIGRYMRSMNATKVANEQLAGFCNNLPMILDELQTIQKTADFDDVIYMLCEGTGKARGSRDGGLREQSKWLNTIITNGEQPISTDSRAGAVNRVISIEADGEIIPGGKEGMSEFAEILRENYGHAGRMIVNKIMEAPDFKEVIKVSYNHNMKKLAAEVTGKQANYGAALLVGDAILCTVVFGNKYRPLMAKDILPYLATAEMVDTNEKIKDWLVGWVVTNIARFVDERNSDSVEIKGPVYGRIAANGDVVILKSILAEQMTNRGRVPAAFMRWCNKKGFIMTNHSETNRHWDVWASIPGVVQSSPAYWFKKEMFVDQGKKTAEGTVVNVELPF